MKVKEIIENAAMVNALMKTFAQKTAERTARAAADTATKVVPKMGNAAATAAPKVAILADQLAVKAGQAGVKLEPIATKIWDKSKNTFVERGVPVVNYDGRAIVIVTVDGVRVPFYLSTGDAGKKGVAAGKWYPIFGIGPDGWINKGTENGISKYYGMPNLKRTAERLDAAVGDIRTQINNVSEIGVGKFAVADINQGLAPVAHDAGFEAFKKNAYSMLRRLGADV